MAKRGEKTCVKRLEIDHGCILLSANGPSNPQNIIPVVVMETVNTYFKIYRTRVRFALVGKKGEKSKARQVKPIQRLDCAVKYKSLVPHGVKPSKSACARLVATPPNAEIATSDFNICDMRFRILIIDIR